MKTIMETMNLEVVDLNYIYINAYKYHWFLQSSNIFTELGNTNFIALAGFL